MKSLTIIFLAVFALGITALPCYADTMTQTTTTVTTTLREDAPIYMGPVQDMQMEQLTLRDFQQMGTKPIQASELYNEYKIELNQPKPNNTMVPYKIKITDRDLTIADFRGANVSEELAQARYQAYLRTAPTEAEAANVRWVYIYHKPL